MWGEAVMEGFQDRVNEAIHERRGEIITEADDEQLIEELENRGYKIERLKRWITKQ